MLDIGFSYSYLSNGIWKLKKLRHFRGNMYTTNIVHIDMSGAYCLTNLETLQLLNIELGTKSLLDKRRFPKLRKLGLRFNPEIICSVREELLGLHRLNNLHMPKLLSTSDIPLDPKAFPSNLTKITMRACQPFPSFNYNCMATLGRLTNLRVLKVQLPYVKWVKSYGAFCCVAGSFPKLEVFQLKWMLFQRWILEKGAMPCLQHLVVECCSKLNELPEQLWSLTALQDVLVVEPTSELRESLRHANPQNGCELIIKD